MAKKKKTSNCAGIYYFIYEKIVAFAKMSMKILSHLRSRSRSKSSVRQLDGNFQTPVFIIIIIWVSGLQGVCPEKIQPSSKYHSWPPSYLVADSVHLNVSLWTSGIKSSNVDQLPTKYRTSSEVNSALFIYKGYKKLAALLKCCRRFEWIFKIRSDRFFLQH